MAQGTDFAGHEAGFAAARRLQVSGHMPEARGAVE
jgi:hypothetical protein